MRPESLIPKSAVATAPQRCELFVNYFTVLLTGSGSFSRNEKARAFKQNKPGTKNVRERVEKCAGTKKQKMCGNADEKYEGAQKTKNPKERKKTLDKSKGPRYNNPCVRTISSAGRASA